MSSKMKSKPMCGTELLITNGSLEMTNLLIKYYLEAIQIWTAADRQAILPRNCLQIRPKQLQAVP